jgi:hypothetical protein
VKKACDIDQHGAPPMDGSKEEDQAGYTENPYWGAAKKACGIDQYRAPPMDESKDNQAGGGGAHDSCSGQGAGGSRDRDSEGVRVGCDEGRAGQKVGVCSNAYGAPRVGARGDSGAHGGAYGAPATATTPTTRSREAVVVA